MGLAFSGCTNLKTYVGAPKGTVDGDFSAYCIPDTVTGLVQTFMRCKSLVTAPTIPATILELNYAFAECSALTGVLIVQTKWPTSYDYCLHQTNISAIVGDCVDTGLNSRLWNTK